MATSQDASFPGPLFGREVSSMLPFSVIVSLILLLITNWVVRRSKNPTVYTALWASILAFGPVAGSCFMPVVALQSLLLVLAVIIWGTNHWQPRSFMLISTSLTAAAYGIVSWVAIRECSRLRE